MTVWAEVQDEKATRQRTVSVDSEEKIIVTHYWQSISDGCPVLPLPLDEETDHRYEATRGLGFPQLKPRV